MIYYDELIERCNNLGKTDMIGKTRLGYDIPLVRVGKESADTLLVCSVHAREHITTELLFALLNGTDLSFDFLPVLNIDGVLLCKYGAEFIKDAALRSYLYGVNGGNKDFSQWKANVYAVDINVNFNAGWGSGAQNVRYPSPANYIGKKPESEPETQAAARLADSGKYAQIICYHSKGEVIYWGYGNNYLHYSEAKRLADTLNYELTTAKNSAGGMKDYFDLKSSGLGLTVEVGSDKFPHPYPIEELGNLIKRHAGSLEVIYDNGKRIAEKIYGRSSVRS